MLRRKKGSWFFGRGFCSHASRPSTGVTRTRLPASSSGRIEERLEKQQELSRRPNPSCARRTSGRSEKTGLASSGPQGRRGKGKADRSLWRAGRRQAVQGRNASLRISSTKLRPRFRCGQSGRKRRRPQPYSGAATVEKQRTRRGR